MIVYVESNFVLELAFLQEGSENTNAIIEIAEAGRIRLVLPAYCAGEPYERLVRRARDRKALREKLAAEIRELSRSKPYGELAEASRELTSILAQSADQEKRRLETVLLRLLAVAEVIPLDSSLLETAIEFQPKFALSLRTLSCSRRCRHTLVQCHRISQSSSLPRIPKTSLLPTFKSDWAK
jgi:predicted nucleic acid-binding protein